MTNRLHWRVLHAPLRIREHHHHDGLDLFPDFGRQVPFGVGTSVMYNYIDYRFKNPTNQSFQIRVFTDEEYLIGFLYSDKKISQRYHIKTENEYFSREDDGIYRNNQIFRNIIDVKTGNLIEKELIKESHAKICYEEKYVADKILDRKKPD